MTPSIARGAMCSALEVAAAPGVPPACSPVTAAPAVTVVTLVPTPSATVDLVEPGGLSADPAATGYPAMPDRSHVRPPLAPAPIAPDIQRMSGQRSVCRREVPVPPDGKWMLMQRWCLCRLSRG